MSLFDGSGGTIWASNAFSFDSPMKDLLDGGEFTLEQLLREDELLQEIKGVQPQVIDFLAQPSSIQRMIYYLTTPCDENGNRVGDFLTHNVGGVSCDENDHDSNDKIGIEFVTGSGDGGVDMDGSVSSVAEESEPPYSDGGGGGDKSCINNPKEVSEEIHESMDEIIRTHEGEGDGTEKETSLTLKKETHLTESPLASAESIVSGNVCSMPDGNDATSSKVSTNAATEELESSSSSSPVSNSSSDDANPPERNIESGREFEHESNVADVESTVNIKKHDFTCAPEVHWEGSDDNCDDENIASSDGEEESSDGTMREIRYPYMACEIICCDNPRIIDLLVDGIDEVSGVSFLDQLFSLLDLEPEQMEDRLSGYFEKVLTVLFQRRAPALSDYIHRGDVKLLSKFMKHLGSFSIMQLLQRLLLPTANNVDTSSEYDNHDAGQTSNLDFQAVSISTPIDDQEQAPLGVYEDNGVVDSRGFDDYEMEGVIRCNWGNKSVTISLLVSNLTTSSDPEVSANASELLVTLVQQSPLNSVVLRMLSTSPMIDSIVRKATVLPEEEFVRNESPMTASMNLLEAIVLQFGGFGCVAPVNESMEVELEPMGDASSSNPTESEGDTSAKNEEETGSDHSSPSAETVASSPIDSTSNWTNRARATATDLARLLPDALFSLKNLLANPVAKTWTIRNQMGETIPLLGASRLRIVRLVEALVLLAHPHVDEVLISSGILETVLELFFEFEWCSMLHQSAANMLVHVLENGSRRPSLQAYIVNRLNLLQKLLNAFEKNEQVFASTRDTSSEGDECNGNNSKISPVFRLGYMGHVIIICQAIIHACNGDSNDTDRNTSATNSVTDGVISRSEQDLSMNGEVAENGKTVSNISVGNETGSGTESDSGLVDAKIHTPLALIILQSAVREEWIQFTQSSLTSEIEIQNTPLGGTTGPPQDITNSSSPLQNSFSIRYGTSTHNQDSNVDYDDDDDEDDDDDMLDMNENDLDIAASMMEAHLDAEMMNSNGGCVGYDPNEGEKGGGEYYFDDPLGCGRSNVDKFGVDNDVDKKSNHKRLSEGKDEIHDKCDEDDAYNLDDDGECGSGVPVMDLFAGNFYMASTDKEEEVERNDDGMTTNVSNSNVDARAANSMTEDSWTSFADFESNSVDTNNPDDELTSSSDTNASKDATVVMTSNDCSFDADFATFTLTDRADLVDSLISVDDENTNGGESNAKDSNNEDVATVEKNVDEMEGATDKKVDPFGNEVKFSIDEIF